MPDPADPFAPPSNARQFDEKSLPTAQPDTGQSIGALVFTGREWVLYYHKPKLETNNFLGNLLLPGGRSPLTDHELNSSLLARWPEILGTKRADRLDHFISVLKASAEAARDLPADPTSRYARGCAEELLSRLATIQTQLLEGDFDYAIVQAFRAGELRERINSAESRKLARKGQRFNDSQTGKTAEVENRFAPLINWMIDYRQRNGKRPTAGECWLWLKDEGGKTLADPVINYDAQADKLIFKKRQPLGFRGLEAVVRKIRKIRPDV